MKAILGSAFKQAILILVVGVVVGTVFNAIRQDGIALVAEPESFRIDTEAEFIRVADARRIYEQGKAVFIDAGEPERFAIEHIEGAMNVPASAGDVDDLAWLAPADPFIICYTSKASQRQAGVLADKLLQVGFKKVYVLHGGIEAWKELGLPVER